MLAGVMRTFANLFPGTPPLVLGLGLLLAACGGGEPAGQPATSKLPETFFLAAEPPAAESVVAVRERAKTGEDVVLVGKVKDFTDGLAAITVADLALKSCEDMKEQKGEDHCETPWDYCCEDPAALKRGLATVEFRDGDRPLPTSVRGFHGVDHLTTVVIRGRAVRDDAGNLLVVATGIHPR
jgi:hypothetical protein